MTTVGLGRWLAAIGLAVACAWPAAAQGVESGSTSGAREAVVTPLRWPAPVYPQIAQSARIAGDVEVAIDVRADGSVAAADAMAGPPLLRESSAQAARRATFWCRDCPPGGARYSLYVTYRIVPDGCADAMRKAPLVVSPTQGWVTVDTTPAPMHILYAWLSVRGPRCLYLWRCDSEWGGMRDLYERVRDSRCLGLWKCGWKKLVFEPVTPVCSPAGS